MVPKVRETKGVNWLSPEDRAEMLARYQQGERPKPLAAEYGITTSQFQEVRRRAGVPPFRPLPATEPAYFLPVVGSVRLVSRPGEEEHWTCSCGQRVHDDFIFCPACLRDRPGYSTTRGGDDGRS